jgi:hypothetical protein
VKLPSRSTTSWLLRTGLAAGVIVHQTWVAPIAQFWLVIPAWVALGVTELALAFRRAEEAISAQSSASPGQSTEPSSPGGSS